MRFPSAPFCVPAIAALMLSASTVDAQGWLGGFKGGIGAGSFTGHSEFEWKPTFSGAGFIRHPMNDRIAQVIEVGFSRANGESNILASSTTTFVADYVNVPLLFEVSLSKVLGVRPYVLAGPGFSLRLGCSLDFVSGSVVSRTPCDNTSLSQRLDVGAAGGAGLAWQVRGTTFSVEGRGSFNFRSTVVPLDSKGLRTWSWGALAGASVPIHFRRRRPTIGPIPPGYMLVPNGVVAVPQTLPGLPVVPAAPSGGTESGAPTKGITVTANDADARSLLIAIAREAGINIVVSSDVRQRVSLSLTNASPDEAIAAIIAQAGLTISRSAQAAPAIVFYQLPVNVNQVPAETIAVRFGVSNELAKFVTESRPKELP